LTLIISANLNDKQLQFDQITGLFDFYYIEKIINENNLYKSIIFTTLASTVVRAAIILIHEKSKVFCTSHGYLFNETMNRRITNCIGISCITLIGWD